VDFRNNKRVSRTKREDIYQSLSALLLCPGSVQLSPRKATTHSSSYTLYAGSSPLIIRQNAQLRSASDIVWGLTTSSESLFFSQESGSLREICGLIINEVICPRMRVYRNQESLVRKLEAKIGILELRVNFKIILAIDVDVTST
jgi:hypothetical protein